MGLILLVMVAVRGLGQTNSSAAAGDVNLATLRTRLQGQLQDARADLGRLQNRLAATNLPTGVTLTAAAEQRWTLQSLVRAYEQHLDDLTALEAVEHRREDLENTIKAWSGFPQPPPYSILLVDDLRDTVQSLQARMAAAKTTLGIFTRFNEEAEAALADSDRTLRKLSEELETATDASSVARLQWDQHKEQIRNRLAAAGIAARDTNRRQVESELAESARRLEFVRRQLAVAVPHARFSQSDLDKVLAMLDEQRLALETEYQAIEAEKVRCQQALVEAREALRQAIQVSATTPTNTTAQTELIRRQQAEVHLRGVLADTCDQQLSALRQMSKLSTTERGLWQMRFTSFNTGDLDTLQKSARRLEQMLGLVVTAKPYFTQQIESAAQQIAEQENRLRSPGLDRDEAARAREMLGSYQRREEFYHRGLRSLQRSERLVRRWQETLETDRRALPLTSRVRDLFSGVSSFVAKLWNFELLVVEDTITVDGQPITGRRGVTVGKICLALVILLVGYWLTGWVSRLAEPVAIRRLKIAPNQANLIRRWVRVVLVLALVVFSLVSVKIPLTVFAFAGGALAIGVGFGMQNLLKNFISGIIILFERPFRVGDVLDLGGQRGMVTSIGIRSSVLALYDGTETLIPNSALLENNVTNWTYSNRTVRFTVTVGVAYGSDTRKVAQLLAEVAERHGQVQKEPKPQVLFTNFADSSLAFELRYWVDVLRHSAAQIGSDLRHMIAGSFAEQGISIAFPQQDVHLDTPKPLQVQMVPLPPSSPATAEKPPHALPG